MSARPRRIHLVGIGGIGLSAIARVLLGRGEEVSGSDVAASPVTDELARQGVRIFIGHRADNVDQADLVLVTSAAQPDNPELVEARLRGIPIVKRSDFFPELTAGQSCIAIAGTHGKTTTTGMIATVLLKAGLDPSVVVGGMIPELGGNGRAGRGRYFVVEADEYDRAFLGLTPAIAVVTSIEMDHPDCYRDLQEVADAFYEFMERVPQGGLIAVSGEAERAKREARRISGRQVVSYGFGEADDWRAANVRLNELGGSEFLVSHAGAQAGEFGLQVPGRHNVLNALAAIAVAEHVGIDLRDIAETLRNFRGASRRFEVKGEFGGITIVDDYAHHPSEIRATLAAARGRYAGRNLWAVFQPHTFSRTLALADEFARAFADADHVVVTEIFPARERPAPGISGSLIVQRMKHPDARFIGPLDETVRFLQEHLRRGDVLVTLGAGDVYRVGAEIGLALQGR